MEQSAARAAHLVQIAGIHLAGLRIDAAITCLTDYAALADSATDAVKAQAAKMLAGIASGDYSRRLLEREQKKAPAPVVDSGRRHIKVNKANRRRRKAYLRREFARICGAENRSHAAAERETQCSHWEACITVRYLKRTGVLTV